MKRMPEWIERGEEVRFLLDRGRRPEDQPRGGLRGYFARVSEIRSLHEALGNKLSGICLGEVELSCTFKGAFRTNGGHMARR
jgi:hypothetical protein